MTLTPDEIALYDRQIRLWGVEAQQRLLATSVLLINLLAVGSEVAKNLVLGGVGSLTIADTHTVVEPDLLGQFFLAESDLHQPRGAAALPRIQELNRRVRLAHTTQDYTEPAFLAQFSVVVATEVDATTIAALSDACSAAGIAFYAAGLHGLLGYVFVDLGRHTATREGTGAVGSAIGLHRRVTAVAGKHVTTTDTFRRFADVLVSRQLPEQLSRRQLKRLGLAVPVVYALWDVERPAHTDAAIAGFRLDEAEFAQQVAAKAEALGVPALVDRGYVERVAAAAFCEFTPTAAIAGGALAQDVINMVGGKEAVLNNLLIVDGVVGEAQVYQM